MIRKMDPPVLQVVKTLFAMEQYRQSMPVASMLYPMQVSTWAERPPFPLLASMKRGLVQRIVIQKNGCRVVGFELTSEGRSLGFEITGFFK